MNKVKNLIIYLVFPVLLMALAISGKYYLMIAAVVLFFTVFTIFKFEDLLKIAAGYNMKRGRLDKAIRRIYKAYKLKNSSGQTALMFIYMLLKAGKYDKAGEVISKVEEKDISDADRYTLLINKALFLWKKNRITEAVDLYEQLLERGESSVLYGSYGYVVILTGDIQKAVEVNEKAYEYNPNDKAIMDNLGLAYTKAGKFDQAYDIYDKLMKKEPSFPEAYYNNAELLRLMRDYNGAVRQMKKCLTMKFDGLTTITKKEAEKKMDQLKRLQGSLQ
jgi:tetratricopeptide (TPR) repeat protein